MTHELKIWPVYFDIVLEGAKTFEIRKNDRDFSIGDYLLLQEYDPDTEEFTGRELTVVVTYMTNFCQQDGYVVLAIKKV